MILSLGKVWWIVVAVVMCIDDNDNHDNDCSCHNVMMSFGFLFEWQLIFTLDITYCNTIVYEIQSANWFFEWPWHMRPHRVCVCVHICRSRKHTCNAGHNYSTSKCSLHMLFCKPSLMPRWFKKEMDVMENIPQGSLCHWVDQIHTSAAPQINKLLYQAI